MMLSKDELINIKGGASGVSGTLINSIVKLVSTMFDIGKTIGSAIRYKKSGYTCSNTK